MIGFYFGTSRWGDIPQTLGLTVDGGVMKGLWQGFGPLPTLVEAEVRVPDVNYGVRSSPPSSLFRVRFS